MKVYLAARYSRGPELQHIARMLGIYGFEVTSRWITGHGGELAESFPPAKLNDDPEYCARFALVDIHDLEAADVVVSFTDQSGGKGGRHVEFGYGLALGKPAIVVGPRENVFHTLPQVRQVWNAHELIEALQTMRFDRSASTVVDRMREGQA